MSRRLMVVLWLIMVVLANGRAADKPADFDRFWQQALVRLQSWPAQPQWQPDALRCTGPGLVACELRCRLQPHSALPPVLYLTDRQDSAHFDPGSTHSWVMLDLRAVVSATTATGPDPALQPTYRAILLAQRALALLLDKSAPAHARVGLVGEGNGGAVALALAALCPGQVAFVAAHQPVSPPAARAYLDLSSFADQVRCPTLLSYGGRDTVAPAAQIVALFEELPCAKELVVLDRARHCQPEDLRAWSETWKAWAGEVLGIAAPSA